MSYSSPTPTSTLPYLPTSLLSAIHEAGSYPPPPTPNPPPRTDNLHTRHALIHASPRPTPNPPSPIQDIVFRLLTWPLSSTPGSETITVTVGLPLVMRCFAPFAAEYMHYDERVHRLCLRAGADVIWRGEQLGLPKTYLDWLCAEGQKGSMNVLSVGCEELEKGLERWQEVTGRRL